MNLVFATHNPHKLEEVRLLLPSRFNLLSLDDIGCSESIAETASTLEGNAKIKANYVYRTYGFPCFADDTGLMVEALHGAPGVHSARYAGDHKSDADNIEKLLRNLQACSNRNAYFRTVFALKTKESVILFKGEVHGIITQSPKGSHGFGYDPVFQPQGYSKTFAELPITVKNEISHRRKALDGLLEHLDKIRSF